MWTPHLAEQKLSETSLKGQIVDQECFLAMICPQTTFGLKTYISMINLREMRKIIIGEVYEF